MGNMDAWIEEATKETMGEAVNSPLPSGYSVVYNDEESDFGGKPNAELNKLQFDSGINILSHMELCCAVSKDEQIVAALYTSRGRENFDFDIIVGKDHQRMGIASHLIDLAIAEGRFHVEATGGKIVADCVNPNLLRILKRKGFEVTSVVHNHTNMVLKESLADSLLVQAVKDAV